MDSVRITLLITVMETWLQPFIPTDGKIVGNAMMEIAVNVKETFSYGNLCSQSSLMFLVPVIRAYRQISSGRSQVAGLQWQISCGWSPVADLQWQFSSDWSPVANLQWQISSDWSPMA